MLRIHDKAWDEFFEAVDYYSDRSLQAANRFIDEVEGALNDISIDPLRNRAYRRNYRVRVLRLFPYSIFYRVKRKDVYVLAIYHEARKPGEWRSRNI